MSNTLEESYSNIRQKVYESERPSISAEEFVNKDCNTRSLEDLEAFRKWILNQIYFEQLSKPKRDYLNEAYKIILKHIRKIS